MVRVITIGYVTKVNIVGYIWQETEMMMDIQQEIVERYHKIFYLNEKN
jgi:hypothetical protein